MTALWVTLGVLGVLCLWLGRHQPKEYTQVDALDTLKKLYVPTLPRKKRKSHIFRFSVAVRAGSGTTTESEV